MYIKKKVKLISHDCLPILMFLYIMLYIVLAYLIFAAFSNAVCLYNAFFAIDFCKCFLFSRCLSLFTHSLFISRMILHHAQRF